MPLGPAQHRTDIGKKKRRPGRGGGGGGGWAEIRTRGQEGKHLVGLVKLIKDLLQGLEPLGQQVAVLQHDPQPTCRTRLNHLRGLGPHSLPQRHVLQLHPCLVPHLLTWTPQSSFQDQNACC